MRRRSVRRSDHGAAVGVLLCALAACRADGGAEPGPAPADAVVELGPAAALFVPAGTAPHGGRLDLVVHLHGSMALARAEFAAMLGRRDRRDAALITVHVPGFSSVYVRHFADPGRLPRLCAAARDHLRARWPGADLGRLVVTAFSAGYGGVRTLLGRDDAGRIDAVVLADGLHAGLVDGRPDPAQMAPFVAFARAAAAGQKTLCITHSAIDPVEYASTTACAGALLAALAIDREPWAGVEPPGMQRESRAARGRLEVLGYRGTTAKDHTDHFRLLWRVLEHVLGP